MSKAENQKTKKPEVQAERVSPSPPAPQPTHVTSTQTTEKRLPPENQAIKPKDHAAPRKITPEVVRTVLSLKDLGYSNRKISAWFRSQTHLPWISRQTVDKIVAKAARGNLNPPRWLEPERLNERVDVDRSIESANPSLSGSFNHGLGSTVPRAVVHKIVRENNRNSDSTVAQFIQFRQNLWTLKKILNPKELSPRANRFRELHKKLFESLGFTAQSSEDGVFGLYDSTCSLGLAVIALTEKEGLAKRLKLDKLAVACVAFARPQWIEKLETITRTFICPNCKRERTFYEDRKNGRVICAARNCGRAFPLSEAQAHIKVKVKRLDPEYLSLVKQAVEARSQGSNDQSMLRPSLTGSSKSSGPELTVEPRPQDTLASAKASNPSLEEMENVSGSQDS